MTRRGRDFIGILWFLVLATLASGAEPTWRAGSARVEITPEQPMWMSGYGGRDHPAEGKETALWAKAVVLEDPQGKRAVLVTLDLVGIDRATSVAICARIEKQHGLSRSAVALNCSHTHCGPVVGTNLGAMYFFGDDQWQLVARYTERLQTQVVDLVGKALTALEPATIEWGEGTCDVAVNRRNNKEAEVPQIRASGATLRGPVDHRVPVLVVRGADRKPRTIVFGYACHATVLSFYRWCADYPGFATASVEAKYPGAIALFWAGCGADQNPLPRRTVELAQSYGRRLADSVGVVVDRSDLQKLQGSLKTDYREIPLPLDTLPTREELVQQAQEKDRFRAARAKLLLAQIDAGTPLAPTYPYPVQVWHVGPELRWVFLGGEVVVDYALRLAGELQPRPTWLAGYSNDVMAYIPSRRVWTEGGYEGATSMIYYGLPTRWAPTVEEQVIEAVHVLSGGKAK